MEGVPMLVYIFIKLSLNAVVSEGKKLFLLKGPVSQLHLKVSVL